MGLRLCLYYFKHAFLNMVSHRLIHAISMGTITISLILFGLFMLFFLNIEGWITGWGQSSLSMSVYLREGIREETRKGIEATIKSLAGAELKHFISKEEAMRTLKGVLGSQAGLLDGLTTNPLPASFEIYFRETPENKIDPRKIKEMLERQEGVEEVQYTEQWHERIWGFVHMLRIGGFAIIGFLCLAILFVITNTIKLTIYSRRFEVEILKLVGATDWFVKTPFLIEGALQGFMSGLVALLFLYAGYTLSSVKEIQALGLPAFQIVFFPPEYTLLILSFSLVIGLLGGLIAIGRFL